ncbi:MAG: carbohydrate binding family 9 domain-containing protein, partial [Rhodothermales bacterium]|nr:carbohydrate binding family 9 domain-containing protein [Rhodothermales bacterium]
MRLLLLLLLPLLTVLPAAAQNEMHLTRLEVPIRLDGQIDDDEWASVQPLPLIQYAPEFGQEPTEHTEIRIGYDDTYLYVGALMQDSLPGGVRANTLYRDAYSGDDTFGLVLDTFNDNENALWFFTTPNGVRVDMAVSSDGEGGFESMNRSWNTYWDVATTRDDQGWYAELRIPYSSLGFTVENGQVRMGLISYRFISRKNERHIFPAIDPAFRMGFAKPSQGQTVVLEGVESRKPLYITPFVTAGASADNLLNANESAYVTDRSYTRENGLDLNQTLGSNLTLD